MMPPMESRMMRRSSPWIVFVLVLVALAPRVTFAADPFYERLLDKGKRALVSNEVAAAVEDLRLACFGLLDEPSALTDCLVHLALAQARADDPGAFRETFARLLDLELRFDTYGEVALESSVRLDFEAQLEALIPYETLVAAKVFRPIAERVLESRLTEQSLPERREQLAALRTREPDELRWLVMMAEVELESGNLDPALEMASAALRQAAVGMP